MSTTDIAPEFIRPSQIQARFGISRSVAYELIGIGKIKSKVLRRPGNIRGMRLVSVESIRQFIEAQPES
jgi:hypothetical protein